MGKKKNSYKNCKVQFSGPNNPFNLVKKRSNSSTKWKNTAQRGNQRMYREDSDIKYLDDSGASYLTETRSRRDDVVSNSKRRKLERKIERDSYKTAFNEVEDMWRKNGHLVNSSSGMFKPSSPLKTQPQDSFDLAKNDLIFDQQASEANSIPAIKESRSRFDIEDLDLDKILENAADEFQNKFFFKIYLLAKEKGKETLDKILTMLDDEYKLFSYLKKHRAKSNIPRPQAILLFSIIGNIYSLTELEHSVASPAMIFMGDILFSDIHNSYSNLLNRLSVCGIFLDYLSKAKKWGPEPIHFLKQAIQLALPKPPKRKENSSCAKKPFDLVISEKVSTEEIPELFYYPRDRTLSKEGKKIALIDLITNYIFRSATLYNDYEFFKIMFDPFLPIYSNLPSHFYPLELQTKIGKLIELLSREEINPPRPLQRKKPKPTPLKMYEPAFKCKYESIEQFERNQNQDNVIEHNRREVQSKNNAKLKNQQKHLKSVQQKIKKEERLLLRDVRRSAKEAAALQIAKKIEADKERKSKTNKILNELAVQESTFKKMMKK